MIHLHHMVLTLHRDRTLEVCFSDGKPVDRTLPDIEFLPDPPTHPDDIGGHWYGDRLDLDHCLAAFGI